MSDPTLDSALRTIQAELKAPKGKENEYGGFFYRSAEDILQAVKPLLAEHELLLLINDDIKAVGDRYYVHSQVTLRGHNDVITTSAFAREALTKKGMDEAQLTGATSSYARKYALNGE